MTAPTDTPDTPASSAPASGGANIFTLAKEWGLTVVVALILYSYMIGQVEAGWIIILLQGLPIVASLSLIIRLLSQNRKVWSVAATWTMIFWIASIIPQVYKGVDEMTMGFLYDQSYRLGKATDGAKEKVFLNRSADLTPSNQNAREAIYEATLKVEESVGGKLKTRLDAAYQKYNAGSLSLEELSKELEAIEPRLHLADKLHEHAMRMVKGPETSPVKKSVPPLLNIPHLVWLGITLLIGYLVIGFVHSASAKIVTLLLTAGVALFSLSGIFSDPQGLNLSAFSNFSFRDPRNFGYIVIVLIFLMLLKKPTHASGGGH